MGKPVYYGYGNDPEGITKQSMLRDTGKGEFIMARVYNFSAGPSMLPEKVLRQAQAELLEYGDSGQSVMEMSHRSKWFDAIIKDTEATLRRVMNIPDNYKVGFFQGGATQQFAMVPLNFMTTGKADYIVSGNFSGLAAKEAAKFGEAKIVASSKDKNFTYIPDVNAIDYDKDASYIHICQNNTIFGTKYVDVPQVDGIALSCAQFAVVIMLSAIGALAFGEHTTLEAVKTCIPYLLYVGVVSSGVGYTLQILAQKGSNPTVVTILLSLESVFAVIAGAIILHQSMTPREYLGCVLMFLAVILAQIPLPAKAARAESK